MEANNIFYNHPYFGALPLRKRQFMKKLIDSSERDVGEVVSSETIDEQS